MSHSVCMFLLFSAGLTEPLQPWQKNGSHTSSFSRKVRCSSTWGGPPFFGRWICQKKTQNQRRMVGKSGNPGWIWFGRAGKSGKSGKSLISSTFQNLRTQLLNSIHPACNCWASTNFSNFARVSFSFPGGRPCRGWCHGVTVSRAEKLVSVVCPILIWVPFSLFLEMIQ